MRIAAFQMKAMAGDPLANLARIESAAEKAAAGDAELLIVPELALPGYGAGNDMHNLAEPPGGETIAKLALISLQKQIAVLAGFAEAAEGATYNSAVFVDRSERPVIYRKTHLYGDYERGLFAAERPYVCIVEHGGLKIGVLICYDVEFPENVRRLAQAGAQLVAVPTALPSSDHAELIARKMIPVRAFENQVFLAYVNHCGADDLFVYAGLSTVSAPDGSLLAEADDRSEALHFADIRPEDFAASAAANPYLKDLRS